jgi:hypothetical protein
MGTLIAVLGTTLAVAGCPQHVEAPAGSVSAQERREALRASIVLPHLTLWGARGAVDGRFGPGEGHRDEGWKSGASVRGYRAVTVRVARRDRVWVSLDYGEGPSPRLAGGDPVVRFEPCPPGTRRFSDGRPLGAETGWAGGFVVARPGCATLFVRRAGDRRSTRVRIGFGVRCRAPTAS